MKINIKEYLKQLTKDIIIKQEETELVFFSDTYKEFKKYDNTFYFKRLDTKNIADERYIIYIKDFLF